MSSSYNREGTISPLLQRSSVYGYGNCSTRVFIPREMRACDVSPRRDSIVRDAFLADEILSRCKYRGNR